MVWIIKMWAQLKLGNIVMHPLKPIGQKSCQGFVSWPWSWDHGINTTWSMMGPTNKMLEHVENPTCDPKVGWLNANPSCGQRKVLWLARAQDSTRFLFDSTRSPKMNSIKGTLYIASPQDHLLILFHHTSPPALSDPNSPRMPHHNHDRPSSGISWAKITINPTIKRTRDQKNQWFKSKSFLFPY